MPVPVSPASRIPDHDPPPTEPPHGPPDPGPGSSGGIVLASVRVRRSQCRVLDHRRIELMQELLLAGASDPA
eukprot:528996-Rhodomonas_salina.1